MTLPLRTSRSGLEFIKSFEGFRARAARLPDGRWTIGHGHVRSAREGVRISRADAEALLIFDLQRVEEEIEPLILAPLNANQFDALVSFVYNISPGQFRESDVLRRLDAGDYLGAAKAMEAWSSARVNGRLIKVDALVRRRAAEVALFLEPVDGRIPAPTPFYPPEADLSGIGEANGSSVETATVAPSHDVGGDFGSLSEAVRAMADRQRASISSDVGDDADDAPQCDAPTEADIVPEVHKTPLDAAAELRDRINRVLEREEAAVASRSAAPPTVREPEPKEAEADNELPVFVDPLTAGEPVAGNGDDIAERIERALAATAEETETAGEETQREVAGDASPVVSSKPQSDRTVGFIDDTEVFSSSEVDHRSLDERNGAGHYSIWQWLAPVAGGVVLSAWGAGRLLFPSDNLAASPAPDTIAPVLLLGGAMLIMMGLYFLASRRNRT